MYVSYLARVKRLKILYCIKSGQCLLIAGCTSLEEAEKNIEGNAVTDFSISSLPPGKRKRFTRRNYLWIESLNCIGKGPSSLTKAGIPIANFSTLLLIRIESMHTLFGQEINKQREEEARVPETGWGER